jgi:glycosyltransferase involved in cell wall biosynthesis
MQIIQISTYGFDRRYPSRPEFVLARTLAAQGHTVHAIEYWHDRTQPQVEVYAPGLTIYRCRTFGFVSYDLLRFARQIPKPDIIHVHHLRHLLAYQAQILWRGTVPMVLTPHGILHDGDLVVNREQPLDNPLTPENLFMDEAALWSALRAGKHPRRTFRNYFIHAPLLRYDGVFALSNHEKSIIGTLGVPLERITVIPNSIVLSQYQTPPPRVRASTPTLLFIGQLVPRKGWDILVDALPKVVATQPDITVIMVTHNTSQLAALEARATALGVRAHIDIRTRVDEAHKVTLLESAHMLVAPSRYEGFGIPPIEAMAAGCAVITTDCAAGNEIVTHMETGLLTRYNDPSDLADAVLRLLRDDRLRDALVERGKTYVHATYDPDIVAHRSLGAYQSHITRVNQSPVL